MNALGHCGYDLPAPLLALMTAGVAVTPLSGLSRFFGFWGIVWRRPVRGNDGAVAQNSPPPIYHTPIINIKTATSKTHLIHHLDPSTNRALYFTIADRWAGTFRATHPRVVERTPEQQREYDGRALRAVRKRLGFD